MGQHYRPLPGMSTLSGSWGVVPVGSSLEPLVSRIHLTGGSRASRIRFMLGGMTRDTGWDEPERIDAETFDKPDEVSTLRLRGLAADAASRKVRILIDGHSFPVVNAYVDPDSFDLILVPGAADSRA